MAVSNHRVIDQDKKSAHKQRALNNNLSESVMVSSYATAAVMDKVMGPILFFLGGMVVGSTLVSELSLSTLSSI